MQLNFTIIKKTKDYNTNTKTERNLYLQKNKKKIMKSNWFMFNNSFNTTAKIYNRNSKQRWNIAWESIPTNFLFRVFVSNLNVGILPAISLFIEQMKMLILKRIRVKIKYILLYIWMDDNTWWIFPADMQPLPIWVPFGWALFQYGSHGKQEMLFFENFYHPVESLGIIFMWKVWLIISIYFT